MIFKEKQGFDVLRLVLLFWVVLLVSESPAHSQGVVLHHFYISQDTGSLVYLSAELPNADGLGLDLEQIPSLQSRLEQLAPSERLLVVKQVESHDQRASLQPVGLELHSRNFLPDQASCAFSRLFPSLLPSSDIEFIEDYDTRREELLFRLQGSRLVVKASEVEDLFSMLYQSMKRIKSGITKELWLGRQDQHCVSNLNIITCGDNPPDRNTYSQGGSGFKASRQQTRYSQGGWGNSCNLHGGYDSSGGGGGYYPQDHTRDYRPCPACYYQQPCQYAVHPEPEVSNGVVENLKLKTELEMLKREITTIKSAIKIEPRAEFSGTSSVFSTHVQLEDGRSTNEATPRGKPFSRCSNLASQGGVVSAASGWESNPPEIETSSTASTVESGVPLDSMFPEKTKRSRGLEPPGNSELSKKRKIPPKPGDPGYEAYRAKRDKNNLAVRKSREKTKIATRALELKEKELEEENSRLNTELKSLNEQISILKSLIHPTPIGMIRPESGQKEP